MVCPVTGETEVGRVEVAAVASSPQPQVDHVQVIKVEGTQQAPGGAIMIRKPSGSSIRRQEEEVLPQVRLLLNRTCQLFRLILSIVNV